MIQPERTADPPSLYERDFNLWVDAQVDALRAGRFADIDLPNVIEEIESLGKSERSKIESQLARLWLHVLKLRFQPERRSRFWESSVAHASTRTLRVLRDSPSLRRRIPEFAAKAYPGARRKAAIETGLPLATFPAEFPFVVSAQALAEIEDDDALDEFVRKALDGER